MSTTAKRSRSLQYDTETTPETIDRSVSPQEISATYDEHVAPFFPLVGGECVRSAVCLYTCAADTRFIIDILPDTRNVLFPLLRHGFNRSAALARPSPPGSRRAVRRSTCCHSGLEHEILMRSGNIYVGIGGWTYKPWRGVFYPEGLPHARELEYAAQHLTSIEVNGTFYRTQSPKTFRDWASHVPDGFVFSLKGPRYAVNRRVLAGAADSIKRFFDSGPTELGDKLGPLLWQFAPTKKFDETDFGAFLELLPQTLEGRSLRHVVEVRHDSFKAPAFIALLRQFSIPVVYADHATYTEIADVTGDFVYVRLQRGQEKLKAGYPPKALDQWAERAKRWAAGGTPKELPRIDKSAAKKAPRDTFIYFIHEAKVRAPAAAMALIIRLK